MYEQLGLIIAGPGQLSEAEPLYIEAMRMQRGTRGDEHPDTLWSMITLITLSQDQGKLSEAGPLFMEGLRMPRSILGDEHPDTSLGG